MNLVINKSEAIVINESGFNQITIETEGKTELDFTVKTNIKCSLFVECLKAEELSMKVNVHAGSSCTLLFWNSCNAPIKTIDTVNVENNAVLHLAYGELSLGDVDRKCHVHLNEEGAEISLRTAVLSKEKKDFELICQHHAKHTLSNMKNYYVLLENGSCRMDATGKIDKGASGSKSHQVSRGLTFDQQKRAVILPQLLIDENDVEASHATTLGQIDENQMYYLQSRGLSRKEATQLITTGYLLPIADEIEDEELRNRCREEIETKVNESCSM